jgi:hypothetical protein
MCSIAVETVTMRRISHGAVVLWIRHRDICAVDTACG